MDFRGFQQQPKKNRRRFGPPDGQMSSGDEALMVKETMVKININDDGDRVPLPMNGTRDRDKDDSAWGENTTCVTGNTSERSYSGEALRNPYGKFSIEKPALHMRVSKYLWTAMVFLICIIAYISPLLMILLPKLLDIASKYTTAVEESNVSGLAAMVLGKQGWKTSICGTDCQGFLLEFTVKMVVLLLAVWVIFVRRSVADLPRLYLERAILLAAVFLFTFAFWLFYGVRVLEEREADYNKIVTYAHSLLTSLILLHYLTVVWLIIKPKMRCEYNVRVVRSPDGEARSYNIGNMSIQMAAVEILNRYYRDFPVYNPYLERLPSSNSRMRIKGGRGPASHFSGTSDNEGPGPTGFKLYDIEGRPEDLNPANFTDVNTQALMLAAARKRESAHNERFYEEIDWERRVRKRRARLMTAAEESFSHIRPARDNEKGGLTKMDPVETARSIFPMLARPLQKYLRITRQQPRFPATQVVEHLAQTLKFNHPAKSFLEKFFTNSHTFPATPLQTQWSLASQHLASRSLDHGLVFQLRCVSPTSPADMVQLLCVVSRLPFYNLTEETDALDNLRFVFKLNSETSV